MVSKKVAVKSPTSPKTAIEISSASEQDQGHEEATQSSAAVAARSREQLASLVDGMLASLTEDYMKTRATHKKRRKKAENNVESLAAETEKTLKELHTGYVRRVIELRHAQIKQLQNLVREKSELEKEISEEVEQLEDEYRTVDRSERVVFEERVKKLKARGA